MSVLLALAGCSGQGEGPNAADRRGPMVEAHQPAPASPAESPEEQPALEDGRVKTTEPDGITVRRPSALDRTTTSATTPTSPTMTTAPPSSDLPPEKCPDAKTCRRYRHKAGFVARWRATNGKVTIPYWVNPKLCTSLSAEDMRRAIHDGTLPWEAAAPMIDFVFEGFTDRVPSPLDGYNDVGCTQANPTFGAEATPQADRFGWINEADMTFAASLGWAYVPCEQRDGSCTKARANDPISPQGGCCAKAMNSVATHEFGHWLWLEDMTDTADAELTMFQGADPLYDTDRALSTLALGDVLGVRSLYPCSCPLPAIYKP